MQLRKSDEEWFLFQRNSYREPKLCIFLRIWKENLFLQKRIQSCITMSVNSFLLISSCHTSSHSLPIAPIWYLIGALAAPLSRLQLLYCVIAAPELRFTGMSAFTAWLTAQISICSPTHDLKGSVLTMYGSSTFLSWSLLAHAFFYTL